MVMKSLEYHFSLFSYSNLSDRLPDLFHDTLVTYTAYVVEHCLMRDI